MQEQSPPSFSATRTVEAHKLSQEDAKRARKLRAKERKGLMTTSVPMSVNQSLRGKQVERSKPEFVVELDKDILLRSKRGYVGVSGHNSEICQLFGSRADRLRALDDDGYLMIKADPKYARSIITILYMLICAFVALTSLFSIVKRNQSLSVPSSQKVGMIESKV
jgi:hypothetical protein